MQLLIVVLMSYVQRVYRTWLITQRLLRWCTLYRTVVAFACYTATGVCRW
jgi:hypothetical protein